MKETGLMFKAPLVRAILEGRKTQTRRVLKPQPAPNHPHDGGTKWVLERGLHVPVGSVGHLSVREKMGLRCPMGQPGDRIYVRETWANGIHALAAEREEDGPFVYAADGDLAVQGRLGERWKPAIHMPKYAARIWLEITGVRVERLQDMSKADAVRDGGLHQLPATGRYVVNQGDQYFGMASHDPRELFQEIWESTGGDWAVNPWVWVIDFKRIKQETTA